MVAWMRLRQMNRRMRVAGRSRIAVRLRVRPRVAERLRVARPSMAGSWRVALRSRMPEMN